MQIATISNGFSTIPLSMIIINPNNPRKYFDEGEMEELTASVVQNGIIQPIMVRPIDNGFFSIVAGERRYRAALAAQLAEIPAVIKEMDENEAEIIALAENVNRADMSVAEESVAADKILERVNGDRDEAAKTLGWPLSKLNRRIALKNLVPEALQALTTRKILVGHAELLASVVPEKQEKALSNIIDKNLTVQQVKDFLIKVSTDFKSAIFNTAACGSCKYNSTIQSSLFNETIGASDRCSNPDCYKAKTDSKIEEIKAALSEEVQLVRVIEVGDNGFTKLIVDGATGVGEEQFETCKICSKLGATVSTVPGEVGRIEREICFDTSCNMNMVANRIKAEKNATNEHGGTKEVKSGGSTSTKKVSGTSSGEPKVAGLSQKIIEYRRRQVWEIACMKELAAQIGKARSFALDLLLTGDGRLMDKDKLTGYFGKIGGVDYPKTESYSDKKIGHPELVHTLSPDKFDKMLAAAAVSAVSSSDFKDERIKKLLGFLECDLTKHFTLTADFLNLLTKNEIEAVCASVGLDKAVKDFKKVLSGKRDDAIKTILASEFQFEGSVPSILDYA